VSLRGLGLGAAVIAFIYSIQGLPGPVHPALTQLTYNMTIAKAPATVQALVSPATFSAFLNWLGMFAFALLGLFFLSAALGGRTWAVIGVVIGFLLCWLLITHEILPPLPFQLPTNSTLGGQFG